MCLLQVQKPWWGMKASYNNANLISHHPCPAAVQSTKTEGPHDLWDGSHIDTQSLQRLWRPLHDHNFLTSNWLPTCWRIFWLSWLVVRAEGLRYYSLISKFWICYWSSQNTKKATLTQGHLCTPLNKQMITQSPSPDRIPGLIPQICNIGSYLWQQFPLTFWSTSSPRMVTSMHTVDTCLALLLYLLKRKQQRQGRQKWQAVGKTQKTARCLKQGCQHVSPVVS